MFALKTTKRILRIVRQVGSNRTTHDFKSICAKLNGETENAIYQWRENGALRVELNNPAKRNAFNLAMYQSIAQALRLASESGQVKCVIFKGKDGFYSSGNDLSYLRDISKNELQSYIIRTIDAMDDFINELIEIRKPLVAAVDGPAIGIGCSSLGLFDSIIASSKAEFLVPFSKIGLVPEGCSSYTFPRILGSIRANQMLFFNHKLTAKQALDWGFISELIKEPGDFDRAVDDFEHYLTSECNSDSIIEGKRLVRDRAMREKLMQVNRTEGELMKQFWQRPAYQNYLSKFYKNKNC